jgi:hypothetical protein
MCHLANCIQVTFYLIPSPKSKSSFAYSRISLKVQETREFVIIISYAIFLSYQGAAQILHDATSAVIPLLKHCYGKFKGAGEFDIFNEVKETTYPI